MIFTKLSCYSTVYTRASIFIVKHGVSYDNRIYFHGQAMI